MNDRLLKMLLAALVVAAGMAVLNSLVAFTNYTGGDTILASFGLALCATLLFVPIAHSIRVPKEARSLVFDGFALRLAAIVVVALVILPYYAARNSADASYYDLQAGLIADQIRAGEWGQINLQAGTQMVSFVTALLYLPFGPSAAGMTFFSGMLGFIGSLCFVGAAAALLPGERLKPYAMFVLMLPSLVFWSTLFGKDSWVFLGLGLTALGTSRWLKDRSLSGAIKMLLGMGVAFAFRPYVALAALLSLAITTFLSGKSYRLYTPISVIKSFAVLLIMVPVMYFMWQGVSRMTGVTEVSEDSIVGRISAQGEASKLGGGSDVSTEEVHGTGAFISQLPAGTVRLLFRPWPWESTSFFMLAASLDNIVLIVVIVMRRRDILMSLRTIRTKPYALFCLLLALGLAIVFSTIANLGLLMRQKTQITPFLYFLAFSGDRKIGRRPRPGGVSHHEIVPLLPPRIAARAPIHSGASINSPHA